jgi:serine/threonine protein kinase
MALDGGPSTRAIFDTEIEILTHLSHPHILSLFDAFPSGRDCVLILEFCSNGTIDKYIRAQKLSQIQVIHMLKQVLSALSYCHSNGIALRDIKPANILIVHYGRPKLADFGLSCFVKSRDNPQYAGSLAYIAPELFQSHDDVDLFSSDIWSLGIISRRKFYHLFVGLSPWPKFVTRGEVIRAIVTEGPVIPDWVQPAVAGILARMLAREPVKRPTASELLQDPLFAELGNRPVLLTRGPEAIPRRMSAPFPTRELFAQRIAIGRPLVHATTQLKRGGQQPERRPSRVFEVGKRRNSGQTAPLPPRLTALEK